MIYFLYGTLKKDHRLHFIVEQSDFLGEVETVDNSFDIKDFSYGAFPIVYRKEKEGFKIKGEAYRLNKDAEETVHRLEIGAGYVPSEIKVDLDLIEKCVIFLYPKEPTMNVSNDFISMKNNVKEWTNLY